MLGTFPNLTTPTANFPNSVGEVAFGEVVLGKLCWGSSIGEVVLGIGRDYLEI